MSESSEIHQTIAQQVQNNPVVLYMKGTKLFPQCGFSSVAISILQHLGVEFLDIDVLADQNLREGIKEFSNWPTIPQLYYKGEFIGGCDIMREMFDSGELHTLFGINKQQ